MWCIRDALLFRYHIVIERLDPVGLPLQRNLQDRRRNADTSAELLGYGMGVVVAPTIGPTLGGWITDSYSWRWIFLLNVPIGILSLALTSIIIVDPPYMIRRTFQEGLKIDFLGLGQSAGAMNRARDPPITCSSWVSTSSARRLLQ